MILKIEDWEFDIDLDRTMAYSAAEAAEHCDCAYCRNFYATVDKEYPELRPFLTQFGLDVEAPEEMYAPSIHEDSLDYMPVYVVYGKITKFGQYELGVGRCNIVARYYAGYDDASSDYFVLDCFEIFLPWVLDEPLEDVVSPANEPSFLKKMWERLLGLMKPDGPVS